MSMLICCCVRFFFFFKRVSHTDRLTFHRMSPSSVKAPVIMSRPLICLTIFYLKRMQIQPNVRTPFQQSHLYSLLPVAPWDRRRHPPLFYAAHILDSREKWKGCSAIAPSALLILVAFVAVSMGNTYKCQLLMLSATTGQPCRLRWCLKICDILRREFQISSRACRG